MEALNEKAGITCNRPVDCDTILTIRRFAADDEIGGTNAEKIWNYFLMHGFTKEGAAGIMGNIANEASTDLNPTLLEYGSTSRTSLSGEQYTNRVDAGIISPPADLEDITTDIRMIVIGNVFEWCLKSGDADFEGNMRRSLTTYLNGLF